MSFFFALHNTTFVESFFDMDKNILLTLAETIKAESSPGANTANRIGSLFEQLINEFFPDNTYGFAGFAFPSTNPGTPKSNVFYIASGKGTYTYFGGFKIDGDCLSIFSYNGSKWILQSATIPRSLGEVTPSTSFADNFSVGTIAYAVTPGTYKIFNNTTLSKNEFCVFTKNINGWVATKFSVSGSGGIGEAPIDGNRYLRKDGAWVKEMHHTAIISLVKDAERDYLSVRIDNFNLLGGEYVAACKFFLMRRVKRSRTITGKGETKKIRNKYGTKWANTGVGFTKRQYNDPNSFQDDWPEWSYMWTPTGEKTDLFNQLDINRTSSLPTGLRSFFTVDENTRNPDNKVPFYLDYLKGLQGTGGYSTEVFKEFTKHARKAEIGIALYAPAKIGDRIEWQRISNIAKIVKRTSLTISIE